MRLLVLALIAFSLTTAVAEAKTHRDRGARTAFMHLQPCPSTGKQRGPCPGYVVDHVTPLCAGGADEPLNMQWQTLSDAKIKDRAERAQCRR